MLVADDWECLGSTIVSKSEICDAEPIVANMLGIRMANILEIILAIILTQWLANTLEMIVVGGLETVIAILEN